LGEGLPNIVIKPLYRKRVCRVSNHYPLYLYQKAFLYFAWEVSHFLYFFYIFLRVFIFSAVNVLHSHAKYKKIYKNIKKYKKNIKKYKMHEASLKNHENHFPRLCSRAEFKDFLPPTNSGPPPNRILYFA